MSRTDLNGRPTAPLSDHPGGFWTRKRRPSFLVSFVVTYLATLLAGLALLILALYLLVHFAPK